MICCFSGLHTIFYQFLLWHTHLEVITSNLEFCLFFVSFLSIFCFLSAMGFLDPFSLLKMFVLKSFLIFSIVVFSTIVSINENSHINVHSLKRRKCVFVFISMETDFLLLFLLLFINSASNSMNFLFVAYPRCCWGCCCCCCCWDDESEMRFDPFVDVVAAADDVDDVASSCVLNPVSPISETCVWSSL